MEEIEEEGSVDDTSDSQIETEFFDGQFTTP